MKPSIVQPRTLSGFMELMPADQIKFNRIKSVLIRWIRRSWNMRRSCSQRQAERPKSRYIAFKKEIPTLRCALTSRCRLQNMSRKTAAN